MMGNSSRFETLHTTYGRMVEVGRLPFSAPGFPSERVIVDIPPQDPEYDTMWLALSPAEARRLAGLLMRHAEAAES